MARDEESADSGKAPKRKLCTLAVPGASTSEIIKSKSQKTAKLKSKSPNSAATKSKSPNSSATKSKSPNSAVTKSKSPNSAVTKSKSPNSAVTKSKSPNSVATKSKSPNSVATKSKSPNSTATKSKRTESATSATAKSKSLNITESKSVPLTSTAKKTLNSARKPSKSVVSNSTAKSIVAEAKTKLQTRTAEKPPNSAAKSPNSGMSKSQRTTVKSKSPKIVETESTSQIAVAIKKSPRSSSASAAVRGKSILLKPEECDKKSIKNVAAKKTVVDKISVPGVTVSNCNSANGKCKKTERGDKLAKKIAAKKSSTVNSGGSRKQAIRTLLTPKKTESGGAVSKPVKTVSDNVKQSPVAETSNTLLHRLQLRTSVANAAAKPITRKHTVAKVLTKKNRLKLRSRTKRLTRSSQVSKNMTGTTVKYVKDLISQDTVVIFSKSYCPYCKVAKEVFENLQRSYTCVELDNRDDGDTIQNVLSELTGARTVPRVFVNGICVGGGSDVKALYEKGELQKMLTVK